MGWPLVCVEGDLFWWLLEGHHVWLLVPEGAGERQGVGFLLVGLVVVGNWRGSGFGVIVEASKFSNFSCSSSKVIGMSLAWIARVSSLYSSPRPSSILSVRSSTSSGAPRRASSSIFALMDCRNDVTLS